jgi:hypothetical protein
MRGICSGLLIRSQDCVACIQKRHGLRQLRVVLAHSWGVTKAGVLPRPPGARFSQPMPETGL